MSICVGVVFFILHIQHSCGNRCNSSAPDCMYLLWLVRRDVSKCIARISYGNVAGWVAGWLAGCLSQPVLYQND